MVLSITVFGLLIIVFYLLGKKIINILKIEIDYVSLPVGLLVFFGIFHLLNLTTVIFHLPFNIAFIIFIIEFIMTIFIIILNIKKVNYRINFNTFTYLIIITFTIISAILFSRNFLFFEHNSGDSAFYIPLIKETVGTSKVYLTNPWSGIQGQPLVYMYYFVTYELFVSVLSYICRIDSTVFVVNFIPLLVIVMFISSYFAVINDIFKSKVKKILGMITVVFLFIFFNSRLFAVIFPYNAFNFIEVIYSGKSIYFYVIVPMQLIVLKRIIVKDNKNYFLIHLLINLIVPGLTASSLYLQLIINIVTIIYLIFDKVRNNVKIANIILYGIIPLYFHYSFIVWYPRSIITSNMFRVAFSLSILVLISTYVLFIKMGDLLYYKINRSFRKVMRYVSIGLPVVSFTLFLIYAIKYYGFVVNIINNMFDVNDLKYFFTIEFPKVLLFYIVVFISLRYIHKKELDKGKRFLLYNFGLIMVIFFANPFNAFIIANTLTSLQTYHRVFYILPFAFSITYYIINRGYELYSIDKKRFTFFVLTVLFVTLIPFNTIFSGIGPVNKDINLKYRIEENVVQAGKYYEKQDKRYRVIGLNEYIRRLRMVSINVELVFHEEDRRKIEIYQTIDPGLAELYYISILESDDYSKLDYYFNKFNVEHFISHSRAGNLNKKLEELGAEIIYEKDDLIIYDVTEF